MIAGMISRNSWSAFCIDIREGGAAQRHEEDEPEEEEGAGNGTESNQPVHDGHEEDCLQEDVGHLNNCRCDWGRKDYFSELICA